jgi:transposase
MPAHARTVDVPEADRRELERRVRDKAAPARVVERARIVLLAAEAVPGKQIAAIVGCAEPTVVTWRGRYAEHGLAALDDLPRPGKPAQLPEALRDRVLELTLTELPDQFGATHWSSRLLAAALAGEEAPISHATVARIWHRFGVQPWRAETFKAAQERTITQLQARIAEQDAEIAELRRRLAASSRNSSKPPSTDGLDKPAPKSLRGRSGRKPGGQPGREGRTLRQVAVPDEVVVHEPGACAGCGGRLAAEDPPTRIVRRQVFDIPTITVRVVEHRLISRRCSCGAVTAAPAPAGVSAPVQYGPHAAAIAVYLCLGQHLPVGRTAGLLAERCGTPMATGTAAAWTA